MGLNRFPGQLFQCFTFEVKMVKTFFPNIQSHPPLAQLGTISSCPKTCYLGKETNTHLVTTSVVIEGDKFSPWSLLQTKQTQFP